GGRGKDTAEQPECDAVICVTLPTRDELGHLSRLGQPVVLIAAAQLAYLKSIAAPLTPVRLPTTVDRALDRAEALRAEVVERLNGGNVDAELALLAPLFERFDPAEVAAALLALRRETGSETREPAPSLPAPAAWVKLFVNVGKKDRASAKDLVGALIKEVGLTKEQIGRIDVRETHTLVDVAGSVMQKAVQGLSGVTIRGRRVGARVGREGL
ncbi:MAG: DbpA RNA binding domain-containing protein, partial [Gemmatimonadales bacterium]